MNRRQFIGSATACVFLSLIGTEGDSPPYYRHGSIHPEADIDVFGLEAFGNSVKELLLQEKYVSNEKVADAVRWRLQNELWQVLEPKTDFVRQTVTKRTLAIWIGKGRYLYLEPEFRIHPLAPTGHVPGIRTVGKIEYLSDTGNPRAVTYWTGGPPHDNKTLVIGAEAQSPGP